MAPGGIWSLSLTMVCCGLRVRRCLLRLLADVGEYAAVHVEDVTVDGI